MNHDKICNAITKDSNDDFDALYRLLYARGFLVEKDEKGIVMSDNAYDESRSMRNPSEHSDLPSDWRTLIQAMGNMIHIEEDHIVSCTDQFSREHPYDVLFCEKIGFESLWFLYKSPLNRFKRITAFPAKLMTMELEPFVAMYVKAVSAIQLETILSCQGHVDKQDCPLYITFANHFYTAFHNALWATDTVLRDLGLIWRTSKNEISIKLNGETADDIYVNVIKAGQYIYENRINIREMRKTIANQLTKDDENLSVEDLTKRMITLIEHI